MSDSQWSLLVGIGFGIAILLLLLSGSWTVRDRLRARTVNNLVAQYGRVAGFGVGQLAAGFGNSRSIGGLERWFAERFFAANIRGQANSWLAAASALALLLFFVLMLIGVPPVAAVVASPVSAFGSLVALLEFRGQRLRTEFQTELAEGLLILASSLRAGLNFNQALEALATQSSGELGRQFRRALVEVQLGSEMEPALSRVAERTRSGDLEWLVIALDVQREVGGPLAKILDGVAGTIKSRASVRLEANSLAAEGKLSSYVLIALPIGILLFLAAAQPEYIAPLFSTPVGLVMMSIMVLLMIVGWVWLKKITAIKL